jgi:RNA-directed DNA polymerase
VVIVRFADDYIVGFEHRDDAERFLSELRERFAKFALELHPEKTRLIEFGRHAARARKARGLGKPETFEFLGFTHICANTRSGRFTLKRVTRKKRMRAKLCEVKTELMQRRHLPIPEQGRWLGSVVRGHLAYYAVPGNSDAIIAFRTQAIRHWCWALRRRSQRSRLDWERTKRPATRWPPTRPHPASLSRRAIRRPHPRQEPSALTVHAGICAGGPSAIATAIHFRADRPAPSPPTREERQKFPSGEPLVVAFGATR